MSREMDAEEVKEARRIVSQLPDAERELVESYQENLLDKIIKYAGAAIMVRNFSHNLGSHILSH